MGLYSTYGFSSADPFLNRDPYGVGYTAPSSAYEKKKKESGVTVVAKEEEVPEIKEKEAGTVVTKGGKTFLAAGLNRKEKAKLAEQIERGSVKLAEGEEERIFSEEDKELLEGISTELPTKTELDVLSPAAENIPIVGPPMTALSNAISSFLLRGPLKAFKGEGLEEQLAPLLQTPEGRREVMISEIQAEELSKAVTASEAVGAAAEAIGLTKIPFNIGEAVEKFTKTPSEDVETLRERIKEVESRASGLTDAAAQGELGNPTEVMRTLGDIDKEIAKIEAQIKRLLIYSATLRSDPEEINLIEEEILSARTTLAEAQQRAAEGAFITPTEESLFSELIQLKKEIQK